MQIVDQEISAAQTHQPGAEAPNYNANNPIHHVIDAIERSPVAAGLNHYWADSKQYLFAFDRISLAGPSGDAWQTVDPRDQNNKNDFQKQNIRSFRLRGIQVMRGYATAGDWTGPFVRVGYAPDEGSPLRDTDGGFPGPKIRAYIQVGDVGRVFDVPYNERAERYEIELWSFDGDNLESLLDEEGQAAMARGELVTAPDLVRGHYNDFAYEQFDAARENAVRNGYSALTILDRAPDHAMHPVRPLEIQLAFADENETRWDSNDGQNYRMVFKMAFRGWRHYLGVGVSPNPHGGVGFLEFRNLFSNYFGYETARRAAFGEEVLPELGRDLADWNYDADALDMPESTRRPPGDPRKLNPRRESFMAVDYMDLHILNPDCGIGIHRHRDNQEAFFLLRGKAIMLVGDWCQFPEHTRAFEVRTMLEGDISLCKTGQLHALINPMDEPIQLFMFGGYD